MGVSYKPLMWWEQNATTPFVHFWPAIISFLGYEPWPKPVTLGERLKAERRRRGFASDKAALVVGVDEGTFLRWERGKWQPQPKSLSLITAFLGRAEPM
jgi:DNA-binding XRE family transcriptional regulator